MHRLIAVIHVIYLLKTQHKNNAIRLERMSKTARLTHEMHEQSMNIVPLKTRR